MPVLGPNSRALYCSGCLGCMNKTGILPHSWHSSERWWAINRQAIGVWNIFQCSLQHCSHHLRHRYTTYLVPNDGQTIKENLVFTHMAIFSLMKERKSCHLQEHGRTLRLLCHVKCDSHRRTDTAWWHWHVASKTSKHRIREQNGSSQGQGVQSC